MIRPENGGSAFPSVTQYFPGEVACNEQEGMSLRDYFAAKAMQGLQANPAANTATNAQVAESSYRMADAMLKARGAA